MGESSIAATGIVVFRETLEAGLIVGIIFTALARLRAMRYASLVWASVAAAVAVSAAAGGVLASLTAGLQGRWEKIIEGVISLGACGVLTYMVFWMDRQARRIRPELEEHVEQALSRHELFAIAALPFLAVLREGAETVLFLKAVSLQSGDSISIIGGVGGGLSALAVTLAIFVGGRRVPLKPLFRSTGVLLLLIAAGLLAYGIHELEELGWLPPLIAPVWNINHLLNEKAGLGAFLKALFGYNGNPSLLELLGYGTYLAIVLAALRAAARRIPQPMPASAPASEAREATVIQV